LLRLEDADRIVVAVECFNAERPATDEMADAFPPAVDGATGLR
jgi:hypothetical protein